MVVPFIPFFAMTTSTTLAAVVSEEVSKRNDVNSSCAQHHGDINVLSVSSSSSSATPKRQHGCRKSDKCQHQHQASSWVQFNVAANGHDYLGCTGRSHEDKTADTIGTGISLRPNNIMVPHGESLTDSRNTVLKKRKDISPNTASSSGLVLRKEKNHSWSVKFKECPPPEHVRSSEFNLKLNNDKSGWNDQDKSPGSVDNNNVGEMGKVLTSPCDLYSVSTTDNSKILTHVPNHVPYCNSISKTCNDHNANARDKGKLCTKIRIKDVNGNGPLVQMVPPDSPENGGFSYKRRKGKSLLDGTNAVRKSATIINGKYWNGEDLSSVLEEREEVEEAAYKALASSNGLPKTNKSVKKAEKEIAHALEIIQLQLEVLQSHKKQSKLGGIKSGKVTKKEKAGSGVKSSQAKKRRHTWEPSYTITFADFFQLPPSLIVKDNDLHPACSMRADPCCPPGPNHPIWRWKLGKTPLPPPPARRLSVENSSEGTSGMSMR